MAIWRVWMLRTSTASGHVTVEAESAQAAECAAYEFLENGGGNDYAHWVNALGGHRGDNERPRIRLNHSHRRR